MGKVPCRAEGRLQDDGTGLGPRRQIARNGGTQRATEQDNALRRLSELESLQLSAYVNEHTNKREEIRYTVRFGYFKNKSSALAALDVFEQNLSGSGYVARIRRPVIQ